MKSATVTVTFDMPFAWSEEDTVETGLQPARGVNAYLVEQGISAALTELAERFSLELRRWGVSVHEQKKEIR